jgi:hypothetical protein
VQESRSPELRDKLDIRQKFWIARYESCSCVGSGVVANRLTGLPNPLLEVGNAEMPGPGDRDSPEPFP